MIHDAVLKQEVLEYLDPRDGKKIIDCTVGEGGHAKLMIEKGANVLGIDQDPNQIKNCQIQGLLLINDSYINLKKIVENNSFYPVSGILLDLGMSSWQLEKSKKGFSFLKEEMLDMRYGYSDITAEEIVNSYPEKEIERILREYGEERYSRKIAKEIIEARPIKTTLQLVDAIRKAVPRRFSRVHFATRTFQALRIAVNDELGNLEKVLPQAVEILEKGGRLVVISFHSLEDRIVKHYFKSLQGFKILTKKPIIAKDQEAELNPRSRSAKLRAVEKI